VRIPRIFDEVEICRASRLIDAEFGSKLVGEPWKKFGDSGERGKEDNESLSGAEKGD